MAEPYAAKEHPKPDEPLSKPNDAQGCPTNNLPVDWMINLSFQEHHLSPHTHTGAQPEVCNTAAFPRNNKAESLGPQRCTTSDDTS